MTAPDPQRERAEAALKRIPEAVERITSGRAPMRIPANLSDPDLVLTQCELVCRDLLASLDREAASKMEREKERLELLAISDRIREELTTLRRERDEALAGQGILQLSYEKIETQLAAAEKRVEELEQLRANDTESIQNFDRDLIAAVERTEQAESALALQKHALEKSAALLAEAIRGDENPMNIGEFMEACRDTIAEIKSALAEPGPVEVEK